MSAFYNNYGSVIKAIHTDIKLYGCVTFFNNFGIRGPAINVENGGIFLTEGLEAYFAKNTALTLGGAIYASADPSYAYVISKCSFRIPLHFANISIYLEKNTATQAGSAIYVTHLYNCLMYNNVINTTNQIYKKVFKIQSKDSSTLNAVSTLPHMLSLCKNNTLTDDSNSNFSSCPGGLLHMCLAACYLINLHMCLAACCLICI